MLTVKMPTRTRDAAKANEDADVKAIVAAIQAKSPAGEKLTDIFARRFGRRILAARQLKKVGGRSTHFDLEIEVEGEGWRKVEHKGSATYKPIDPASPPWTQGVQFYNGTGSKYTLAIRYATEWHAKYIASGHLSKKLDLKSEIPSLEEWLKKDAFVQGNPKTSWGKELRSKFRPEDGSRMKRAGCFDERDEMKKEFKVAEKDLATITDEVLALARDVLAEKHYWLQIQGDVEGDFFCEWHPQIQVSKITGCEIIDECSDVLIRFQTDMGFPVNAMLRWGKGQGLSNIRIDLR